MAIVDCKDPTLSVVHEDSGVTSASGDVPINSAEGPSQAAKGKDPIDQSSHALEISTIQEVPSPEEEVAYRIVKARHLRRLQDRWRCKIEAHTYCFSQPEPNSIHIQLSDEQMEDWTNIIFEGYATLSEPPKSITGLDARSISSVARNTVTFQRPFRFKSKLSLSDLRSMRSDLTSSTTTFLGIGSITGRGINWFGNKMLDLVTPLEVRRRIWIMKRAMKRIDKLPPEDKAKWLMKRRTSMLHHVDDLLELSTDKYKQKQRADSKFLADEFSQTLWTNLPEAGGDESEDTLQFFQLMNAKLYPLASLCGEVGDINSLGIRIRELQLQEDTYADDVDYMFMELINIASVEIYNSESPVLRCDAMELLDRLWGTQGRAELERLGRPGGFLEFIAERSFNNVIGDHDEHATTFRFFVFYARDHPAFRKLVLGPNGLPLLVSRFKNALTLQTSKPLECPEYARGCTWALSNISECQYAIPALQELDLIQSLVQPLTSHNFAACSRKWDHYYLMRTLSNLMVNGDESGKSAILAAITPELTKRMRNIVDEDWSMPWAASNVRLYVKPLLVKL